MGETTLNDLPPPMTPADCDLRGLEYMPLHGAKLFASDFYARASDAEFRAGMSLWWEAWQQVPAASLPDDDVVLCRLADLARDIKTWRKIKAMAMHGFVLCSDGRWYHEFLAQQALVAWDKRVKERERKAQWREKRQGRDADVPRDRTGTGHGTGRGRDADVPADGNRRDGTVIEEEEGDTSSSVLSPRDDDDDVSDPVSIANSLCRQAGVNAASPKAIATAAELVRGWQQAGATPDLMGRCIAHALPRATEPVVSLRYFDAPIRNAIALEAQGHDPFARNGNAGPGRSRGGAGGFARMVAASMGS